jgi:hypothetical protein
VTAYPTPKASEQIATTVAAVNALTFAVTSPTDEAKTASTAYVTRWNDPGADDSVSTNAPAVAPTTVLVIRR